MGFRLERYTKGVRVTASFENILKAIGQKTSRLRVRPSVSPAGGQAVQNRAGDPIIWAIIAPGRGLRANGIYVLMKSFAVSMPLPIE